MPGNGNVPQMPDGWRKALNDYAGALTRSPLSPATRERYVSRVQAYLTWLAESGGTDDPVQDPAVRLEARGWFLDHLARSGTSSRVRAGYRTAIDGFHQALPEPSAHLPRRALTVLLGLPGLIWTTAATTMVAAAVSWGIAKASVDHGDPVSVVVQEDPEEIPAFAGRGQSAVLARGTVIKGAPGSGCDGFASWLRRNAGVPVPEAVQIVVQSSTTAAVLINGLRVVNEHRAPPPAGPRVVCPSAGNAEPRMINIDLDTTPARVSYVTDGGHDQPFGFTLHQGETEVFDVTATTTRALITFDLKFELVVGGRTQSLSVADNGRPFSTTAFPSGPAWSWNYKDAWTLVNGDQSETSPPVHVPAGSPFPTSPP